VSGDAEGAAVLSALATALFDHRTDGAVGAMGCPSRDPDLAATTLRSLPPPANRVLYLIGDSTLKSKRGRKHHLGHCTRHGEHEPYMFGFQMVVLIARWDGFLVPAALGLIDPQRRRYQHLLFRQMLKDVVPPAWVRQTVVVADAGCAANETLRLITARQYAYNYPSLLSMRHQGFERFLLNRLPWPGHGEHKAPRRAGSSASHGMTLFMVSCEPYAASPRPSPGWPTQGAHTGTPSHGTRHVLTATPDQFCAEARARP